MTLPSIESRLRRIVELSHPHPFPSRSGIPASVLLLVALRQGAPSSEIEILITRRTEHLETHKGQYAFPGGMQDPEDGVSGSEAAIVATALREAEEEMGVSSSDVITIGTLPEIWTPSGFQVTPVLGLLRNPIEVAKLVPNPDEISDWFWCPLSRFRDSSVYRQEQRTISIEGVSHTVPVDVFEIDTHRIWGMTGAILKNFIGRWEKLG